MTHLTREHITELLAEIDRTPWGPRERALVEEAVAGAVELHDEELEYLARMRQTGSASMGGITDVMLSSFAWCLAHHDADPQRFPSDIGSGADLMWQFKWMAGSLRASPRFGNEQIAAVLDDMEEHYRRAGLGMSGVVQARFSDAFASGHLDDAERLRITLETTPRDSHSHCEACARSELAGFFAETGRGDDTIRLVEELIEGRYSCGEEPEHALSLVLVPYLRAGRLEEAKTAHLRSYRLGKDNPDLIVAIANSIVFCAITGNEPRALAFVERHLRLLAHDPLNARGHFRLLTAIATTLDRVTAVGHGETPVRGAAASEFELFFGAHDGDWTAAELAPVAWAAAEAIGRRFDERDGTDRHAKLLADARTLACEHYDVPISSDVFIAPFAEKTPTDAEGWYLRILDLVDAGAIREALESLPRVIDIVDPAERAVLMGGRLASLVALGRSTDAAALLPDRIRALRETDRHVQADVEERFGLAMFGEASPEQLAELVELHAASGDLPSDTRCDLALTLAFYDMDEDPARALAYAREAAGLTDVDERARWSTTRSIVTALLRTNEFDEPIEVVEKLLADAGSRPGRRAWAHDLRARLRGGKGEFAEGGADADELCRILAELGGRHSLANAHLLAGALYEDGGYAEQALARYRVAARLAEQEDGDLLAAKFRVGRTMLATGHAVEAAEELRDVLTLEESNDVPAGSRGMTAHLLGQALRASDEFGAAYGAYGRAAELFGEAGSFADQATSMADQATLLHRFGEQDEAVELLEQAAGIVRTAQDSPAAVTRVLHDLGQVYANRKDERAFALFDEVEQIALDNEAPWLVADVTDSRARAFATLEQPDAAVATALAASDGYAAAGDERSAAGSALLAARVLTHAEREADSVPVYRAAIDHATDAPDLRQLAALELGDVLQGLGRVREAQEAREIAEA